MSDSLPQHPADSHTRGAVVVFTVAFLASIVAVGWLFFDYLTDFLLASVFVALMRPLYLRLRAVERINDTLASTLVSLLLVVLIALPTTFLVISLSVEAQSAFEGAEQTLSVEWLEDQVFGDHIIARGIRRAADLAGIEYTPASVKQRLTQVAGTLVAFLGDQAKSLLSLLKNAGLVLYHFTIMMLFFFYLLIDADRLKAFMFQLSPLPDDEEEMLTVTFANVARAIFVGNGVGSLIQGVLGGVAMAVVGVPHAILWGTIMTIFAFLPLVGVSVVSIPITLWMFAQGDMRVEALVFFGFTTAMALFVENIVKTRLIGSHMQMHNLLIFLSLIAGLAIFGVMGILYGPLIVALFLTLHELYIRTYKQRMMGSDPLA